MSAGLYQPTPHRVINTSSSKTRTSVAFFYEPVRCRRHDVGLGNCSVAHVPAASCTMTALVEAATLPSANVLFVMHRHSRPWSSQRKPLPRMPCTARQSLECHTTVCIPHVLHCKLLSAIVLWGAGLTLIPSDTGRIWRGRCSATSSCRQVE